MNKECELRSLSDLEEKLGEVIFSFDAVVPDITKELKIKRDLPGS